MKSFSASSFAGAGSMDDVAEMLQRDPSALFTDFQYYLLLARNTVFFTAYSDQSFTKDSLAKRVSEMVALAPQLTHGFKGARPGQPLSQAILEAITRIEEVDSFEGYPDKWLSPGLEVFEDPALPLFRVTALVRRGGPDEAGRASMFLFRCSHALMEGSDSALLARSQSAAHGRLSNKTNKLPFRQRLRFTLVGTLAGTINLALAHATRRPERDMGFRTVALKRDQLRRVSRKLGVGQRALMFSLVMYALNQGKTPVNPNVISVAYTMLDTTRHDADDDFFRVNVLMTKFDMQDDLTLFIRSVQAKLTEEEAKDPKRFQFIQNAVFSTHRRWSRLLPFLYGKKFWSYSRGGTLVLTLIPPHRLYGDLSHGFSEPIHAGSWHPSANLCTFVPAQEFATLNFSMDKHRLLDVPKIQALLDELDAKAMEPLTSIPARAEE